MWKLTQIRDGKEIKQGDSVVTFRGENAIMQSMAPPRHSSSAGKITIKIGAEEGLGREVYATVCGLQWIWIQDN